MARMPTDPGRRILELGAGVGVAGIVAAAFGHCVTVTDFDDEILDFARVSAAVNGCEGVFQKRLDWLEPDGSLGKFEIIIGSEILFNSRFFAPLLKVFEIFLAPNGVIYLSHDKRRKSLAGFLGFCSGCYDIAIKEVTLHSGEDESFQILLTRLTPK
ncbi:MAG: class I SAM-dependent methyltransferase, partial [Dissulfurimicrobium sp.]